MPAPLCQAIEGALGLEDMYAIPFSTGQNFLGTLAVLTRARGLPETAQALEAFAGQAGMALERWQAAKERARYEQELRQAGLNLEYELAERERAEHEREHLLAQVKEERQRAEQAAAELEAVFNSISDAVFVYSQEGLPIRANPAAEKMLGAVPAGLNQAEIIQRLSIRRPDGAAVRRQDLPAARAIQGQRVRGERLLVRVAGQEGTILASADPLVDAGGQICGAVSVWRDISLLEQAARIQENRWASG